MLYRSRIVLALLSVLLIGYTLHGRDHPRQSIEAENNDPMPLCKFLGSPDRNENKEVMVRATYRVGYEASELYCLSCSEKSHVWVKFNSKDGGEKAAKAVSDFLHHAN